MKNAAPVIGEDDFFILSGLPPSPAQKWFALAFVCGLLVVFALITAGPLSGVRLGRVDAFVPAYATALFVNDMITAILLYAQFSILRSRASLVIASGYLFSALILIPWILVFPGIFAPSGVLGGMQSTSWLYFIQHAGFPLFVIAYALSKDADPAERFWHGTVRAEITSEHRLDRRHCLYRGDFLHRRRSAPAARDARFHPSRSALALCRCAGRIIEPIRAHYALVPAALDTRPLADGGDVLIFAGDTVKLLSGPGALQLRLVYRPGDWVLVQQPRSHCALIRDYNDLRRGFLKRSGPSAASARQD